MTRCSLSARIRLELLSEVLDVILDLILTVLCRHAHLNEPRIIDGHVVFRTAAHLHLRKKR